MSDAAASQGDGGPRENKLKNIATVWLRAGSGLCGLFALVPVDGLTFLTPWPCWAAAHESSLQQDLTSSTISPEAVEQLT